MRIEAQTEKQRLMDKLSKLIKQEPAILRKNILLPHPDNWPKEKDFIKPSWQTKDR